MRQIIKRLTTIIFLIITILVIQVLGFSGIVGAITHGQPDGNDHPYVCIVVFDVWDDDLGMYVPAWRTTGFLISETVAITAAHGVYSAAQARIWVDTDITQVDDYPGGGGLDAIEVDEMYYHPDYRAVPGNGLKEFNYHDVGVLILDEAVVLSEYAELPIVGLVDDLEMMASMDAVGYGVQWQKRGFDEDIGLPPGLYPPPPYNSWRWNGLRYFTNVNAVTSNNVVSDEFLSITANPAKGKGGTAFGDSGGPILLADTNTVIAINSFVNSYNCTGITYAQRIDTADILSWINGFLAP
jgi:hypothetical protein